jgi:hypothetical protein
MFFFMDNPLNLVYLALKQVPSEDFPSAHVSQACLMISLPTNVIDNIIIINIASSLRMSILPLRASLRPLLGRTQVRLVLEVGHYDQVIQETL